MLHIHPAQPIYSGLEILKGLHTGLQMHKYLEEVSLFTGVNCGFGGGNPNLSTALSVINDSTPFVSYPASSHWLYKHSLYRYLRTHDSLLSNNYVLHFRDSVRTSNMGMLDSINTVLADSNGVNSGDISAATNLSAAISSPDTIEQTSQTVDNIVIAMQSAHSNFPDSAQIAALQTIAPLCPAEYGNAVFVARALLSQVDTTHYISVCEMTVNNNNARVLGNQPINDTTISAKVYPNPANTELNIEVALQPGETARMCLYNSLGQEVECKDLTKNLTALPTKVFAEGLYYYRITNNSGNVLKEGRQMIVH